MSASPAEGASTAAAAPAVPGPAPAGAPATETKSKADKSKTEVAVNVAEIRKEAQDEAARIAKEATEKAKERLEAEKMQRLQKPRETNTATVREAAKEVVGTVAKVDGVAWTVAQDERGDKHWVSGYAGTKFQSANLDPARVKSHLSTCDCPQDQGALGPGAVGPGAPGQGAWGQGASGNGQVYGSSCVPGTSPFTSSGTQDTRCTSGSVPAVLTSGLLADRPVRLPKVMPAVDVATANAAAEWLQGARLHEQLACANSAAEQRLVQAKQQYYLSIGLLCDADKEAVKQRLEAVVQACAAREFELEEQQRAQSNLEAEIIAAQQIMQDVHADLEGKHAQGDTFGVQYAAEELKLAKYKVLLLLKQKRRLKAMVAIHVCNVREAKKAQKAAECEFADAMARHEHARHVMIRNHDLDDSAEQQLAQVREQLQAAREELLMLNLNLRETVGRREATEREISDLEARHRTVLDRGFSAGQQAAESVSLAGGESGYAQPPLSGGNLKDKLDALKAAKDARKEIKQKLRDQGLLDIIENPDLLHEFNGTQAAAEAQQKADATAAQAAQKAKQQQKEQEEASRKKAEQASVATIEAASERVQENLRAQLHAMQLSTQHQARQSEEVRMKATTGFLGTDKLDSRRDIAANVQLLMSLRFQVRRDREQEVQIQAKIAQVSERIAALEDKKAKLDERIRKEKEKQEGDQSVQPAAPAPAPVAVATTEGCEVPSIGELDKVRLEEIKAVDDAWTPLTVTVVMAKDKSAEKWNPCYGRIIKPSTSTKAGDSAADPKGRCKFEWFYDGQLDKDSKPSGLGTFTRVYTGDKVQRLRGTWTNGKFTGGILEEWTTWDDARTGPPASVTIGKADDTLDLSNPLTLPADAYKLQEDQCIKFTYDAGTSTGTVTNTGNVVQDSSIIQQVQQGQLMYSAKNNRHLLYYLPTSVDSRTAAAYCWQWESDGNKVSNVVVQVGTAVNQPTALAASVGESAKNLFSRFTAGVLTSVTSRATLAGPWNRAVHTGIQCVLGTEDEKREVTGYDNGVLVHTSTGQMLCGLPHGRHDVNYSEGAQFFGDCFNGCPSHGYVTVSEAHKEVAAGGFWGTFLTPSAPTFRNAWMQVSNTGRRSFLGQSDILHHYCRREIVGPDRDSERKEATIAAVQGATAADQTGLTSLPAQVFQENAKNSAQPLCGGADAVPYIGETAHVFGRVPDTVGEQLEGGICTEGRPQSGAPQVDALISAGGDGREWDGGISPSWLQEARRRVDDLCVQMERLHQGDLPASAQVELSERALQYASTFADVLKKKPVCGPGLLRPMARKLAASLDASFAGHGNAQVMAQLAAWFRLEC